MMFAATDGLRPVVSARCVSGSSLLRPRSFSGCESSMAMWSISSFPMIAVLRSWAVSTDRRGYNTLGNVENGEHWHVLPVLYTGELVLGHVPVKCSSSLAPWEKGFVF